MGTTAEKLTYLSGTKTLLKDTINLTGVGITNDTFRSYVSKLKQGYLDILNNGIDTLYNNFPKVSGIGSNLSLTPTYKAPIKLNEIQGNTLQNGTPTPSSPVSIQSVTGLQNVSITGKNLFNLTGETHGSNVNVTQTDNEFELTWTGGFNVYLKNIVSNLDSNKTYTISFKHKGESLDLRNGSASVQTIRTGTNNDYTLCSATITNINNFEFHFIRSSGTTSTAYIKDIQIEQGSSATTYEPYKGNTYEVNLGKNLFDIDNLSFENGYYDANGTFQSATTNGIFDYIEVEPNTTYTLSYNQNLFNSSISEFNSSKTWIKRTNKSNVNINTITTTATTKYLRISFNYNNSTTITKDMVKTYEPQFEKGSSSTSYSEYFPPYKLNTISTYEDSIKKSTGKNLFDKDNSNIVNGFISDGGTLVSDNVWKTFYIQAKPNTTYTIQKISGKAFRVADFQNVPTIGATYISRIKNDTETSITFTTSSTGNYLAVSYIRETDTLTNQQILDSIMINEGSTALPYEPYGKVWYITENIGKVVLNGTQTNPEVNTSLTNTTRVFYNYALLDNDSIANYGLCNQLVYNSNWSKDEQGFYLNNNDKKLIFRMNKSIIGTTVNEVNTYLSSHNLIVYYVQATPTYEVITNTELIEQLETLNNAKSEDGTTNINVTSEDLSMILNVGVLKGE